MWRGDRKKILSIDPVRREIRREIRSAGRNKPAKWIAKKFIRLLRARFYFDIEEKITKKNYEKCNFVVNRAWLKLH